MPCHKEKLHLLKYYSENFQQVITDVIVLGTIRKWDKLWVVFKWTSQLQLSRKPLGSLMMCLNLVVTVCLGVWGASQLVISHYVCNSWMFDVKPKPRSLACIYNYYHQEMSRHCILWDSYNPMTQCLTARRELYNLDIINVLIANFLSVFSIIFMYYTFY